MLFPCPNHHYMADFRPNPVVWHTPSYILPHQQIIHILTVFVAHDYYDDDDVGGRGVNKTQR